MNLDQIQYQIPIPRWGIKINILAKLWANPIPNSNSIVHMSKEKNNNFDRGMRWMNLDQIQYPIPIRR